MERRCMERKRELAWRFRRVRSRHGSWHCVRLEITPDALDGIGRGCVSGQKFHGDLAALLLNILAHESGAVSLQSIPDYQHHDRHITRSERRHTCPREKLRVDYGRDTRSTTDEMGESSIRNYDPLLKLDDFPSVYF